MEVRVRIDAAADGETHMRLDLALAQEAAASGAALVRLYAWSPPAVSIGANQEPEEACDPAACAALGWDVVRRPTGGRAVLHAPDEVTYAVGLPLAQAPAGVLAAYAWLAQGLLLGYRQLGLPAELAPGRHLAGRSGACFDAPAQSEIVCRGFKLAGSAQVRRGGYLLQHGSLPLRFDAALHARLLGLPPGAERLLRRRAAGIADLLHPAPDWDRVAAAMSAGLRQALGGAEAKEQAGCGGEGGAGGAGDPRTQSEPARPA